LTPADLALMRRGLDDPLSFYEPTPGQSPFLASSARIRLLRGANQIGKTHTGSVALHRACTSRKTRARVVAYSWPQSLVIQQKMWDLAPKRALSPSTTFHPARGFQHRRIDYANGSIVDFVTAESGTLAMAGATLDLVWMDEPPPPEVFAEAIARITATDGRAFLTLTPVGRPCGWLRELCEAGVVEDHVVPLAPENAPWMTQAQVDQVIESTLESERPQRIYGAWDGVTPERLLSGWSDDLIFPGGEAPDVPSYPVSVGLAIDHGEKEAKEVVELYAYDERTHRAWLLDEYSSAGKTTVQQDALGVLAMLDRNGLSLAAIDRAHGDTNSGGKSRLTTVNRLFEEAFADALGHPREQPPIRIRPARKGPGSVMYGARVLNSAMVSRRLRVSDRCVRFIAGARHWKGGNAGPDAALKDALDAGRYGLVDVLDQRSQGAATIPLR
jgi:phage terminase large subunit-like protein